MGRTIVAGALTVAVWACAAGWAGAQAIVRVSVTDSGAQANGNSYGASQSADSRLIAFHSDATNLVAGDTNGRLDCFVRDLTRSRTRRVSLSDGGIEGNSDSFNCGLNASGRFVAFESRSTNLVANDVNGAHDIFVRDLDRGETRRASVSSAGTQGNDDSTLPRISPDGRYVLFVSAASNLVPNDTNGRSDVFLRDLATGQTTLVSGAAGGVQALQGDAIIAAMSPDARFITFASTARNLVAGDTNNVADVFVHDRTTQVTTRVSVSSTGTQGNAASSARSTCGGLGATVISSPHVTSDGRFVTYASAATNLVDGDTNGHNDVFLHDRTTGVTERVSVGTGDTQGTGGGGFAPLCPSFRGAVSASVSDDGRYVTFTSEASNLVPGDTRGFADVFTHDRVTHATTRLSVGAGGAEPDAAVLGGSVLPGFGVVNTIASNIVANDTNGAWDVFVVEANDDADEDGLPSDWERRFGLDPFDATGASGPAGDPDGDGLTNAQELQNGTHPRGSVTRLLAEGSQNAFFSTQLALANAGAAPAHVLVRFQGADGTRTSRTLLISGSRRAQLSAADVPEMVGRSFSVLVESDQPIAVERLMSWGGGAGYAGHAETAVDRAAARWYLAEGSTVEGFALFYLLQNPQQTATQATVRYLRSAGLAPIVRSYTLPPLSRTTIPVNTEDPGLAATDVSAEIVASAPIVAERSMYANRRGRPFRVGHGAVGVTAAAPSWFLAEGATGAFFDFYIALANPTSQPTTVEARFLHTNGTVTTYFRRVPANSRETIFVDGEVPGLSDATVSATLRSIDGVPFIAERVMYWGGGFYDYMEAHASAGTTSTAARWLVADAVSGTAARYLTYVLVANTSPVAATIRVSLLRDDAPPVVQTITVPPTSRTTLDLAARFPDLDGHASVLVESTDTEPAALVVERALYWLVDGHPFGAGASSVATPVP